MTQYRWLLFVLIGVLTTLGIIATIIATYSSNSIWWMITAILLLYMGVAAGVAFVQASKRR